MAPLVRSDICSPLKKSNTNTPCRIWSNVSFTSLSRIFSVSTSTHHMFLDHVGKGGDSQSGDTVANVRDSGQGHAGALASILGGLGRLGGRRGTGAAGGGGAGACAAALSSTRTAGLLLGGVLGAAVLLDGVGAVVLASLAADVGEVAHPVGLVASELKRGK